MSRPVTPSGAAPTTGTLSRSNSQRIGHTGSRPVSYIGRDTTTVEAADHYSGAPQESSVLSQSPGYHDDKPLSDNASGLQRTNSQMSQTATAVPSRGGTLKKKASMKRTSSLKRSGSKKSNYAGSVRSMRLGEKEKYEPDPEHNSAFYCPVPITGSPTDLLADRFQAWRKVLKDLIGYFRDLQKSYETRSKTMHSTSNVINNLSHPPNFMSSGGLADATHILRDFHKLSLNESNKSKELENEVIMQLTGLRSDLQQKIKEIKSLSGDFKNSVGKEQEGTKKAVRVLQESLGSVDQDAATTAGKGDPFLVKMGVDRQLEKQIEEENYLHRAYLNLEASGRELESIVVGEIQKAYNVLAGIMKREADHSYESAEKLKEGPLAMAKDHEWDQFVTHNNQMVDPRVPVRQYQQITYAGKDHPAAVEVKSGMLERKSKYLKNYTPGWYVLSPTHLHEFKSADRINAQSPIMSLYLPEQKLGTHSEPGSNSHKFMLKGRQTGSMHRGHSWIFRAETHDTMLAWYNDIKALTEKRGEERNDFVRRTHARTLSSGSMKAPSIQSAGSGLEDDEADQIAFAGEQSIRQPSMANDGASGVGEAGYGAVDDDRSEAGWRPQRPTPGGRFPSDLNIQRGLQAPLSPSSGDSFDETDRDAIAAAGALPGSGLPFMSGTSNQPHSELQQSQRQGYTTMHSGNERTASAGSAPDNTAGISSYTAGDHRRVAPTSEGAVPVETASTYGEWMAPIAAGTAVAGAGLGAVGAHAYQEHYQNQTPTQQHAEHVDDQQNAIPEPGMSSAPIMEITAAPINAPTRPRGMSDSTQDTTIATATSGTSASTQPTSYGGYSTTNVPTATQTYPGAPTDYGGKSMSKDRATNQTYTGAPTSFGSGYSSESSAARATETPRADQTFTRAPYQSHFSQATVGPMLGPMSAQTSGDMESSPTKAAYTSAPSTSGFDSEVDPAGHRRPQLPHSAKSVQTISDLHVPGEFPKSPAYQY